MRRNMQNMNRESYKEFQACCCKLIALFHHTYVLSVIVCAEFAMACCLSREANPSCASSSPKLHLITYLCPDFPLELFQLYQHYLEGALSCESYLIVESRWGAPPAGKIDPFTANEVDIGNNTSFLLCKG